MVLSKPPSPLHSGHFSLTSITSLATEAPSIVTGMNRTFDNISTEGTLTIPSGATGYDVWLSNLPSGWTLVEQ